MNRAVQDGEYADEMTSYWLDKIVDGTVIGGPIEVGGGTWTGCSRSERYGPSKKESEIMGLTVHYNFKSSSRSLTAARKIVEQLRQKALDLPVQSVGEIVEFVGNDCDFHNQPREHPHRWLLIQAEGFLIKGDHHVPVPAKAVVAFTVMLGDGSEPANFGLCQYPAAVEFNGKPVRTGMAGWRWSSFCKTQYSSSPDCGGVENFLRCHLSLVALLDRAKELGVLGNLNDEGGFFEKRDVKALVTEVGQWNQMIAGAVGRMKDAFAGTIEAEITKFSNYEHLEAKGREGEGSD